MDDSREAKQPSGQASLFPNDVISSPLCEALNGRRIHLHQPVSRAEFLVAYILLHRRVAKAVHKTVDAIQDLRSLITNPQPRGPTSYFEAAASAFQELVYRSAELAEFYEEIWKYVIGRQKGRRINEYKRSISEKCRFISAICNALKHDHCLINSAVCREHDNKLALGFILYEFHDGAYRPRIIKQLPPILSYESSLIHILRLLFEADEIAAQLCKNQNDNSASCIDIPTIVLPYQSALNKIAMLPLIGFPFEWECGKHILTINGKEFGFELQYVHGQIHENFDIDFRLTILTPSFQIFDPYGSFNFLTKVNEKLAKFEVVHMRLHLRYNWVRREGGKWLAELGHRKVSDLLPAQLEHN